MTPLILIFAAIVLLAGFLLLTRYEAARGARLFAPLRERLDGEVERALFVAHHVDFNAFVYAELRALAIHVGHFIAHVTLQAVRAVERLLTQAVRYLRHRVATDAGPARETSRPFVQALDDFKEELKQNRPEIPEL
jgi:hypothetical protein